MQGRPGRIGPVEEHLAYWLHYVGCRVFHALCLKTRGFGVTAAESLVLRKLYEVENGEMPIGLALSLGLSRGYISRLAVRLETKGLIHREKSLSDRRASILTLTDPGRALLSTLTALADKTNGRHFAAAGEPANETIERVLKWVVYRQRFRTLPRGRCRMRKYRYLQFGIDWFGDEDQDEGGGEEKNGEGFS